MDDENEPTTAVISVDGSDPVPMIATDAVEELANEPVPETLEESEAVRVAEIEGETTVAVAAIEADVEQARIDAEIERVRICQENDAELIALRTSLQERDQTIAVLQAELSAAQANQSTPTPPQELAEAALAEAVDATLSEPTSTPQSTQESEPGTELGQSGEEESAAVAVAIAVPARKRRRLI